MQIQQSAKAMLTNFGKATSALAKATARAATTPIKTQSMALAFSALRLV